jgi:hypothetical protein
MAWKDDELGYILGMLATEGDASVPPDSIVMYLNTQAVGANKDRRHTISIALASAAELWAGGFRYAAINAVNMARLGDE